MNVIDSYEAAAKYLLESGWERKNAGIFYKNGWELVWDTSSYIEIYDGENRIAEGSILSREDIIEFIKYNNLD